MKSDYIMEYIRRRYPDLSGKDLCDIIILANQVWLTSGNYTKALGAPEDYQAVSPNKVFVKTFMKHEEGRAIWIASVRFMDVEKEFRNSSKKKVKKDVLQFCRENFPWAAVSATTENLS